MGQHPPIEPAPDDVRARLEATGGRSGLLLVGHGSRRAAASADMATLLDHVRARVPEVAVAGGWIELADPPAADAGLALLEVVDTAHLVVQPLLFGRAYHARQDVPEAVRAVRARRPDAVVDALAPFLLSRTLVELGIARVRAALGEVDPVHDGVVVAPSGTSDPRAQHDAVHAAALVGRGLGLPEDARAHAYASVADPDVTTAVHTVLGAGRRRVAVLSWSLFAGRLVDGVRGDVEGIREHGRGVVFAGRFGPDERVADLVVRRHRAAVLRRRDVARDGRAATVGGGPSS